MNNFTSAFAANCSTTSRTHLLHLGGTPRRTGCKPDYLIQLHYKWSRIEKWKLSEIPQHYKHSSAAFYSEQPMQYSFNLQHYKRVEWNFENTTIHANG